MPRLDLQYRNMDILGMVQALRAQTHRLADHLSILEARLQIAQQDALFRDSNIRDRFTEISLAADNLAQEATVVWKRTR